MRYDENDDSWYPSSLEKSEIHEYQHGLSNKFEDLMNSLRLKPTEISKFNSSKSSSYMSLVECPLHFKISEGSSQDEELNLLTFKSNEENEPESDQEISINAKLIMKQTQKSKSLAKNRLSKTSLKHDNITTKPSSIIYECSLCKAKNQQPNESKIDKKLTKTRVFLRTKNNESKSTLMCGYHWLYCNSLPYDIHELRICTGNKDVWISKAVQRKDVTFNNQEKLLKFKFFNVLSSTLIITIFAFKTLILNMASLQQVDTRGSHDET